MTPAVAGLPKCNPRLRCGLQSRIKEIHRNASSLTSSIQTLSRKAAATGEGLEGISRGIHHTVQTLEADVIEPGLKIIKVVSTLLAFGAVLRRIRHPLGLLLMRGKDRA